MSGSVTSGGLARPLQSRHLAMISIGGIIGSGLFVGSSAAIAAVGPAIVLSYAIAGLLILVVMRMLGDMALAAPGVGSFTELVRLSLGDCAGFVAGWLYWLFWALAIALEALAGASILSTWLDMPPWAIGLGLIASMTAVNLMSARSFGESEFWLSAVKVTAILLFIVAGAVALGLAAAGSGDPLANISAHGGFFPVGPASVLSGVTAVVLALVGAEIVTIAAAESREGPAAVARLTSTLIVRVALFYVFAILIVVALVPWTAVRPGDSPFAMALDAMGAPWASTIMNGVILVAILSCMNSGIYVCSRVLLALVAHQEAPQAFAKIDRRGVPVRAILAGSALGAASVGAAVLSAERLFAMLVNATGMVMLIVYMLLVMGHVRFARRRGAGATAGWLAYAALLAMTATIVAMARTPSLASQAYSGIGVTLILAILYMLLRRRGPLSPARESLTSTPPALPEGR